MASSSRIKINCRIVMGGHPVSCLQFCERRFRGERVVLQAVCWTKYFWSCCGQSARWAGESGGAVVLPDWPFLLRRLRGRIRPDVTAHAASRFLTPRSADGQSAAPAAPLHRARWRDPLRLGDGPAAGRRKTFGLVFRAREKKSHRLRDACREIFRSAV